MKTALFSLILIALCTQSQAQFCTEDNRFTETAVFTNDQIHIDSSVVYGSATTVNGDVQDLILNIFYPAFEFDPMPNRPLIVLMHSGLFLSGSLSTLDSVCVEFSKRGFVAATIEYRKGWEYVDNCQSVTLNTVISANRAIYRGIQDLHAAMRYITHHAGDYHIDTSWIFCGGVSAGAFAAVDMAFITPQELYNLWPYCNNPQFGIPLGYINTSGNTLTDAFSIKGIFHNWGSIIDIDYIKPSNAIPMIGFAGDLDIISPIDSGFFQNCENYELMFGTEAICERLNQCGACTEMNKKIHGGHGVYNLTAEQCLFRIQKASCFFKSLFCNTCTSSFYTDSVPASCSLITHNNEFLPEEVFSLIPNPGSGMIILKHNASIGSEVMVYNIQGKMVLRQHLDNRHQALDMSSQRAGLYFVSVGNKVEN
ncbi:MAG: T9SS type A sorting domain-containing protein [Bacteroidales bacterium]|nr:T9SS type A sorting domain-containing protein [Bacteroidales bacterium]